jgi:hypothetical protein
VKNTADVTGDKPIAVLLQSISGVSAINPLVAFYDIHGGKREALFFYFVPDTTRDYYYYYFIQSAINNFIIKITLYLRTVSRDVSNIPLSNSNLQFKINYLNDLAMRNFAGMTSSMYASTVNPLVAFYDMYGRKGVVLFIGNNTIYR